MSQTQLPGPRRRRTLAWAVLVVMAAGFLGWYVTAPSGALRMTPGPVFNLKEEVLLPAPYTLHDTEGDWVALTVRGREVPVWQSWWLGATAPDELFAESAALIDDAGRAADRARGVALNAARAEVCGRDQAVALVAAAVGDLRAGDRVLAFGPASPCMAQAGEWLVAREDGFFTVKVDDASSVRVTTHAAEGEGFPDRVAVPAFDIPALGDSAGLVQALAWIDVLTSGDLTKGQVVAATGALADDGSVHQVAGVAFKAQAAESSQADLLLVPEGSSTVPQPNQQVSNLWDARLALEARS